MIIITSNFPEKLDKALIRPGRIDLITELGRATDKIMKEIVEKFYNISFNEIDEIKDIVFQDYKWTPAEINSTLFNNFDDYMGGINDLLTLEPNVFQ